MAFNEQDLTQIFKTFPDIKPGSSVAIGLSGGPDSMALCWMLSKWSTSRNLNIHALTIDHGLRAESADEAVAVGESIKGWPNVHHEILRWEGHKPETRILEEARHARYDLMQGYLRSHKIEHLFIAHHQDDQAETFLIRLAKGSGLDGLAGMRKMIRQDDGILVCRPLLDITKEALVALCKSENIPYVSDPTNENQKYLRPRLRAARDILAEEGLTSKRLSVTAGRLARARAALEKFAQDLFDETVVEKSDDGFVFDWSALKMAEEELVLRVLLIAVGRIYPDDDYAPRMEKMENLLSRLMGEEGFKSATLAGCLFALNLKKGTLSVEKE